MTPHLTYRSREAVAFGTVGGKPVRLATVRNQASADVGVWRAPGVTASIVVEL